jgi:exodeoxyribonuclease VIII
MAARKKASKKKTTKKKAAARKKPPVKKKAPRRKKPASEPDPKPKLAVARAPDPEPGIYPGVSREVYEGWDYINNSFLGHFEKSAAHALKEKQHPKAPTPAKILGTHIHLSTLSDDFGRYAACAPINPKTGKQFDRRYTEGIAAWAEAERKARGRTVLSLDDYNTCKMTRAAWRADPTSNDILSGEGTNEVAIVWDDIETGLRCKALIDRLTQHEGWSYVVDLKSTKDASPDGFPWEVYSLRHHRQAAFYLDGMSSAVGEFPRRFAWLAIETIKGPPYTVGGPVVYVPTDSVIEQGRAEYRALLKRCRDAIESGEWAGYPRGLQFFHLPERAYRYVEGAD